MIYDQLSMRRHGAKLDKAIAERKPLPAPLPVRLWRSIVLLYFIPLIMFYLPLYLHVDSFAYVDWNEKQNSHPVGWI